MKAVEADQVRNGDVDEVAFKDLTHNERPDQRDGREGSEVLRHAQQLLVALVARVPRGPHGGERLAEEDDCRRAREVRVPGGARCVRRLGDVPQPGAFRPRERLDRLDQEDAREQREHVALLHLEARGVLLDKAAPEQEG